MARSSSRSPKRSKSAARGKSPGRKKTSSSRSRSKSRERSTRSRSRETTRSRSPVRSRTPAKKSMTKKKSKKTGNAAARPSRSRSRQRSSSRGSVTHRKSSRAVKDKKYRRKDIPDSDSDQLQDWLLGNATNKRDENDREEDFISMDTFDGSGGVQTAPDKATKNAIPACLVLIKILSLPLIVLGLNLVCNRPMTEYERSRFRWSFSIDDSCDVGKIWYQFFDVVPSTRESYYDLQTYTIGIIFYGIFTALDLIPLGSTAPGGGFSDGKRLSYRLGGIVSFLVCCVLLGIIWMMNAPMSMVYDKYIQLLSFAIGSSFVFSLALYARGGSVPKSKLDPGLGSSGYVQLEFAHGREMHPRVGSIDLKLLSWRLGKLTWLCLNAMFMAVSYEYHDEIDQVLFAAVSMQSIFIMDAFLSEEAQLYTFDVTAHGMGWLYIFYRQVFEPFIYTLTTKYLMEHREQREHAVMGIALAVFVFGFILHRIANTQRLRFLKGPSDYPSDKAVDAVKGKRLMTDGAFAYLRYPDKVGELLMVISWSLICGFSTSLVYFPVLAKLTTVLTIALCRYDTYKDKYGESYDVYCAKVKYRLVPFIF